MNPHGYHLLLMRVPSQSATTDPSAATPSAEQARASSAPSADARAVPLLAGPIGDRLASRDEGLPRPEHSGRRPCENTCSHIFCDKPATNGDLCEPHAELFADLKAEYEQLQSEFEDGW